MNNSDQKQLSLVEESVTQLSAKKDSPLSSYLSSYREEGV
jgi:hypothetical protein